MIDRLRGPVIVGIRPDALTPVAAGAAGRTLTGRVRGLFRRPASPEPVEEEHTGHHRRSDLVFSAGSQRPERGAGVRLDVDLDRMPIFGTDGRRVTAVRR